MSKKEFVQVDRSEDEIMVLGAGIVGLAVAYELARRRARVTVVDATKPGRATSAAAGMLAPMAESDVELPGMSALRRRSHALYPDFVGELEARTGRRSGLRREGSLYAACTRDQRQEVLRLGDILQQEGFQVQELSVPQALEREPALSPRIVMALALADDHSIDPRRLEANLRCGLQRLGVRFLAADVQSIDIDAGVVRWVKSAQGDHGAADEPPDLGESRPWKVVLAAGCWSSLLYDALPLRPVKGQTLHLHAPNFIRHVVRTPEVYLVPHIDGRLTIGASVEDQGFDTNPMAGATLDLLRFAWQVLPGIYDLPLLETTVGLRPTSRDHMPLLGRLRDSRFYVATGHYRNGVLLAPVTAKLMADWILENRVDDLLAPFDVGRFVRYDISHVFVKGTP